MCLTIKKELRKYEDFLFLYSIGYFASHMPSDDVSTTLLKNLLSLYFARISLATKYVFLQRWIEDVRVEDFSLFHEEACYFITSKIHKFHLQKFVVVYLIGC